MSEADTGAKADRQFVTSLDRGLRLLACFRPEDRALSNQELAVRTGLPRPTVARFTYTLRSLKYLAYHAETGRYSLTPRVLELGRGAFVSTCIRDIARPAMEHLSGLGPYSIALGVPSGLDVRYLELVRQPEAIVLNLEVGAMIPLLPSAIGRAYLASLTEADRDVIMSELKAASRAGFDAAQTAFDAELVAFRERGYVRSFGAWWPELSAIATTIRIVDDGDPLLLSLSGLSSAVTPERAAEELGPALMNTAQIIQGRMRRAFQG